MATSSYAEICDVCGRFVLALGQVDRYEVVRDVLLVQDERDAPCRDGNRETVKFQNHAECMRYRDYRYWWWSADKSLGRSEWHRIKDVT